MKSDYSEEVKRLNDLLKELKAWKKDHNHLEKKINNDIKVNHYNMSHDVDDIFANSDLIDLRGANESLNDIDVACYHLETLIDDLKTLL